LSPYLPLLSPPKFALFFKIKMILKRRRVQGVNNITANRKDELRTTQQMPFEHASKSKKCDGSSAQLLKEIILKGISTTKL
jgi:DNA-directed RNA polymerase subunit F